MSSLLDDLPPWEGPDLLAEAKAAALKAGGIRDALPVRPRIRLSLKPAERTWADVEARYPPTVPQLTSNALAPSEAGHAWLEKVRAQNAVIAAEAQAKKGRKVGPRTPKSRGTGEHRSNLGRRGRPSKLTDAQVLEIWHSPDTGVVLAERYGVSTASVSIARAKAREAELQHQQLMIQREEVRSE